MEIYLFAFNWLLQQEQTLQQNAFLHGYFSYHFKDSCMVVAACGVVEFGVEFSENIISDWRERAGKGVFFSAAEGKRSGMQLLWWASGCTPMGTRFDILFSLCS